MAAYPQPVFTPQVLCLAEPGYTKAPIALTVRNLSMARFMASISRLSTISRVRCLNSKRGTADDEGSLISIVIEKHPRQKGHFKLFVDDGRKRKRSRGEGL